MQMLEFYKEPADIHIHRKRNPMRAPDVGANAQPRLKATVNRLLIWRTWKVYENTEQLKVGIVLTQVRPYISDRGARIRGY